MYDTILRCAGVAPSVAAAILPTDASLLPVLPRTSVSLYPCLHLFIVNSLLLFFTQLVTLLLTVFTLPCHFH